MSGKAKIIVGAVGVLSVLSLLGNSSSSAPKVQEGVQVALPTVEVTAIPTPTPTQIVVPTVVIYTPAPTVEPKQKNTSVDPSVNNGEGYGCNCAKTCPQMSSCSEAQYQLNVCGCSARDADHDGVACDAQCQ